MDAAVERVAKIVAEHPIVLFMKGTPEFPMCGFSGAAVEILKEIGVEFHAVNVLQDEEIRQAAKVFGNWPTFPQLYVKGELIGGSDVMRDLYASGELQRILAEAI